MQRIIGSAVAVVFAESLAHFEVVVARHSEISLVEQTVQIRTKENAVTDLVWATSGIGPEVCGLQNGK